jgi:predicted alpha/beta superfamily hydrolase
MTTASSSRAVKTVSLYGSVQFDMLSAISGRTYRIFVFKPNAPPPSSGYPVVVTTDGNMSFPIMATVAATFDVAGKPAIVVGVGYPTEDPMSLFGIRNRDLTPPTPLANIPHRPGQPPVKLENYGGSEEFYRFLLEELRPTIAGLHPVDLNAHTLYGHSIAGLFTLGVLLRHPESFRNFVASSPSIFWNKRSVLNDVASFQRKTRTRIAAPRVLISVGGKEQSVPDELPPGQADILMKRMPHVPSAIRTIIARIFIKRMMLDWRMIGNARKLAKQLARINGGPDYSVRFHLFEKEDHLTALPASIGHGLAFALRS